MNIHKAERLAQGMEGCMDRRVKFTLLMPNGARAHCTWLDPYMGLFQVDGTAGFLMSSDFPESSVENQRTE